MALASKDVLPVVMGIFGLLLIIVGLGIGRPSLSALGAVLAVAGGVLLYAIHRG